MKSLFVKAGIMAGLMLMLSIAGNAQLSQQYRAEIPFDFQVKNVSYNAGVYSVGPVATATGSGALAILDRKSGKKQIVGMAWFGGNESAETGKLVFLKANGHYALSQIVTPTFEMKVKIATGASVRISQNDTRKTETVAVALQH